jgi:hypothetical protein
MKAIVLILVSSALLLSARAEQPAYTNHAGYAVSGVVIALDATTTTISNETESVSVPLSIFPESERRRLAADYVLAHPEAGVSALLVPEEIRRAVDANAKAIRRSRLRAEKGLCTQEESDSFCSSARAALDAWLDEKQKSGELLPDERRALRVIR